jgi:hypothetical protein
VLRIGGSPRAAVSFRLPRAHTISGTTHSALRSGDIVTATNTKPTTSGKEFGTTLTTTQTVDLSTISSDANGDPISFSLVSISPVGCATVVLEWNKLLFTKLFWIF